MLGLVRRTALAVGLTVLAASAAPVASAVSWNDYRLGDFYDISQVSDATIRNTAHAVVFFGNATGFVISPDGYILTNHHVYETFGNSGTVYVEWTQAGYRQRLNISLVTRNSTYDMALYKANVTGLPYIPIRTATARVGEDCYIVGHPNTRSQEVSFGRVLAKNLVIAGRPSIEYSAQTWWGSSGSPICDRQGNAIALHWGWDSEGRSNGRLTGVPFDLMAQAVPQIRQIAAAYGAGSSATTTAPGVSAPAPSASLAPTTTTTTTAPAPTTRTTSSGAASGTVFTIGLGQTGGDRLAKAGDMHLYKLVVPARGNLTVTLNGPGNADFDLLVWQWASGSSAGRTVGQSRNASSSERVVVRDANPGTYYLVVSSYRGAGAYSVGAGIEQPSTVGTGTSAPAGTVSTVSGFLGGLNAWELYTFESNGGAVRIDLDGPSGVDFDLYVFRGGLVDPNRLVVKSDSPAPDEAVTFTTARDRYAVLVRSAAGAGRFSVKLTR